MQGKIFLPKLPCETAGDLGHLARGDATADGTHLDDPSLLEASVDVPHRQVVLSVPKRLRLYFLYDRKLLGELSRIAARTVTAFIRATVGEKDLSVGIVSSIQTHGSLANWHPHLHLLVTDGGFRPDDTLVQLPLHDVATLTEAFRRSVLKMFVKRELMDMETAQGMLAWPHSGFHYEEHPLVTVELEPEAVREAKRRWPELLRGILEVEALRCPRCGETTMRIVAFITEPKDNRQNPRASGTTHRSLTPPPTRSAETVEVGHKHRFGVESRRKPGLSPLRGWLGCAGVQIALQ